MQSPNRAKQSGEHQIEQMDFEEDNNPFAGSSVWSDTFGSGSLHGSALVGAAGSAYGHRSSVPGTDAGVDDTQQPYHSSGDRSQEEQLPPYDEHFKGLGIQDHHQTVVVGDSKERGAAAATAEGEQSEAAVGTPTAKVMTADFTTEPLHGNYVERVVYDANGEDEQDTGEYMPYIAIEDVTTVKDRGHTAIAYVIQYGTSQVVRRYSDFDTLRKALVQLLPTVVVPHIPEKHSVMKYFLNPINAKNDIKVIAKRKRLLTVFLQRCYMIPQVRECVVFLKFVDPGVRWADVLASPPVSILPSSNLLAPPLCPTKPSPLHLLLPVPHSTSINNFKPREEDKQIDTRFKDYERVFKVYRQLTGDLTKSIKRQKRHFKGMVKDLGELGAYYNAFSLEDTYNMSFGIEKTGQAIDINYINSEAFAFKIMTTLEEPIFDFHQSSNVVLNVLKFRRLKEIQLFIVETTIRRRQARAESLQNAQEQVNRLSEVLRRNAESSPTIAEAVRRLDKGESAKISPLSKMFNAQSKSDDIVTMTDRERATEVEQIQKELVKLEDCHAVVLKDIEQVNTAVDENCTQQFLQFQKQWRALMQDFTESLLIWLKDNLKAWQDAKDEINKMQVHGSS